jgi:hypothetical protein
MAPLNYDPSKKSDDEGGDYPPLKGGKYEFKVEEADETTFKSGNSGLKVKLLVGYTNGRDVPCFCNLVYTDNMLWKVEDFMDSIGLDFENPPDAWELVGKTGWAEFKVNERGYFEVKSFAMPAASKQANGAGVGHATNDDPPPF